MDIVSKLTDWPYEDECKKHGVSFNYIEPLCRSAATEITSLREENKRMREALKPFADRAGKLDGKWLDHETHWSPAYGSTAITIADLRRAYAALATTGGE